MLNHFSYAVPKNALTAKALEAENEGQTGPLRRCSTTYKLWNQHTYRRPAERRLRRACHRRLACAAGVADGLSDVVFSVRDRSHQRFFHVSDSRFAELVRKVGPLQQEAPSERLPTFENTSGAQGASELERVGY